MLTIASKVAFDHSWEATPDRIGPQRWRPGAASAVESGTTTRPSRPTGQPKRTASYLASGLEDAGSSDKRTLVRAGVKAQVFQLRGR